MAQNIDLLGAQYSDVPAVLLPKVGGGTASFTDVTDTTAAAADVAQGKYFYTSAGVRTEGTSTGGGTQAGTVTQDQDGYLVLDDEAGSGGVTVEALSVTQNGTYTAPTGKAYSPVTVNVSGGGGGDSWSWMGKNPVKVHTWINEKVYLANTAYATWTPTTTQTTLRTYPNQSAYTGSPDYDYIICCRWHTHFEYPTSQSASIAEIYKHGVCNVYGYQNNLANVQTDTKGAFAYTVLNDRALVDTTDNTGTDKVLFAANYGVAPTFPSPVVSGLTIALSATNVFARCSTTYFSTASAAAVNTSTSYYEYLLELWRVDSGTSFSGGNVNCLHDMWAGV